MAAMGKLDSCCYPGCLERPIVFSENGAAYCREHYILRSWVKQVAEGFL
jgi:hypothetical protein